MIGEVLHASWRMLAADPASFANEGKPRGIALVAAALVCVVVEEKLPSHCGWPTPDGILDVSLRTVDTPAPAPREELFEPTKHLALLLTFAVVSAAPARAVGRGPDSAPRVDEPSRLRPLPGEMDDFTWWRLDRLPASPSDRARANASPRRSTGERTSVSLEDFAPGASELPAPGSVAVDQVIVAGDALAESFQELAREETRRGTLTEVRSVSWIESHYDGLDTPSKIRRFLRAAHDHWGTQWVVLGGDVEHVPPRYVEWGEELILTDLYYACLDREWNEDGDASFGEPIIQMGLDDVVNDLALAPGGELWVATYAGLTRLENGMFTTFDFDHGFPSDAVYGVSVAADGSVWAATEAGAAMRNGGGWTVHTVDQGLPSSRVLAIHALSATDVWAGTDVGVAHWNGTAWTSWGVAQGLPAELVTAVAFDGTAAWVGTLSGAAKIQSGTVTAYDTTSSGLRSNWVLSIAVDPWGGVWFGHVEDHLGQGGFSRFANGAWTSDDLAPIGGPSVREFLFGASPTEWWAATFEGLFHRTPGGDELLAQGAGLPTAPSNALLRLANGDLAIGQLAGLSIGVPGAWSTYTTENGLPPASEIADEIDLVPDVTLGRIPASDAAELEAYFEKLRTYRQGHSVAGPARALFTGEVLFDVQDGKDLCQLTAAVFPPSIVSTEIYESDGTLDAASARAAMSAGPDFVAHVSHGSYDVLGAGAGLELLFNGDLDAIDANGRSGIYVIYSCNVGGFDQDCSAEHLLFNPVGGAVATLSNTRGAVAAIDTEFNLAFFEELFASSPGRPAESLRAALTAMVEADEAKFQFGGWWRRTVLAKSFLGPPTLSSWRSTPQALAVTHPAAAPLARTPFEVVVRDSASGTALSAATVCVSKGDEDWVAGVTDAQGRITFQFRPESVGLLDVVVTAPDRRPYEGHANVIAATEPVLVASGWANATPAVDAADAVAPRSTPYSTVVNLKFGLRNVGVSASNGWSATLDCENAGITILQSAGTLAPIASGAIGWTSSFAVSIAPEVPDGSIVHFVLAGSGASSFVENYAYVVESPRLVFERFEFVGDAIVPRIANRGSIAAGGVVATLAPASADAIVIDGTTTTAWIYPGESRVVGDGFRVGGPIDALFALTIAGQDCPNVASIVDRGRPEGARGFVAEPLDGASRLLWLRSDSEDVMGYRVFSRAGNGAWSPPGGELVTEGATAIVSLAPGTSREALVLAVDSSGNASADSLFGSIHAAPATLPGWPQRIASILGPSSLVTKDLDGDGTREVLVGSLWEANAVHAFRVDGTEWTDGDQNPGTNGIFGKTAGRVNAAPLAVDVDGDGSCEVFAPSYDGFVYAWKTNGTPGEAPAALPGWPVAHGENGSRVSPVAGDFDGDGSLEIVTVSNEGKIRVLEANGTMVPGWPRTTRGRGLGSTPAVADLDGDGRDDIVIGATDSTLYAFSGTGANLPGWPQAVSDKILSSPVLADVDGDGDLEIFVFDRSGKFWGFHHENADGIPGPDPLPGWPVAISPLDIAPPSPAVADFDGDGVPEIVVNGAEGIVILRANGTHYPGSPILTGSSASNSPVVADLDGDGALDLLVGTNDRRLLAVRPDGTSLDGWPRTFTEAPTTTPAVADVNGDGMLDVVVGADDATIRVLTLPTPDVSGVAPWPGYHGEDLRGVYRPTSPPPVDAGEIPLHVARTELLPARPNPFVTSTEVRFTTVSAGVVALQIVDVSGRRIAHAGERSPPGARCARAHLGRKRRPRTHGRRRDLLLASPRGRAHLFVAGPAASIARRVEGLGPSIFRLAYVPRRAGGAISRQLRHPAKSRNSHSRLLAKRRNLVRSPAMRPRGRGIDIGCKGRLGSSTRLPPSEVFSPPPERTPWSARRVGHGCNEDRFSPGGASTCGARADRDGCPGDGCRSRGAGGGNDAPGRIRPTDGGWLTRGNCGLPRIPGNPPGAGTADADGDDGRHAGVHRRGRPRGGRAAGAHRPRDPSASDGPRGN